jgi:hypothetical protein
MLSAHAEPVAVMVGLKVGTFFLDSAWDDTDSWVLIGTGLSPNKSDSLYSKSLAHVLTS